MNQHGAATLGMVCLRQLSMETSLRVQLRSRSWRLLVTSPQMLALSCASQTTRESKEHRPNPCQFGRSVK